MGQTFSFEEAQKPTEKANNTFSFEEASSQPAQNDDLYSKLKGRFGKAVNAVGDYEEGKQGVAATGFDILGKTMAGGANDVAGAVASGITPDFVKEGLSEAGKSLADTQVGRAGVGLAKDAMGAYGDFAEKNPQMARHIDAAGNIIGFLPVGKAVEVGAQGAANLTKGLGKGIDRLSSGANRAALVEKPLAKATKEAQKYDPLTALREVSATKTAAEKMGNDITVGMKALAHGDREEALGVRDHIASLLGTVAKDHTIPNKPKIMKSLNHVLEQFDENGHMNVSDAMDLKALANSYYKTKDAIYPDEWKAIHDASQQVLDRYAINNPEFKQMMELQRRHYANDVGEAIKNNDFIQKLFKGKNFQSLDQLDKEVLREAGTDTVHAANSVIGSVKTPEHYKAIRRLIHDPEVAKKFDDALLQQLLPGRWQGFVRSIMADPASTGTELKRGLIAAVFKAVAPESTMTEQEKALFQTIKKGGIKTTREEIENTGQEAANIVKAHQKRLAEQKAMEEQIRPDVNRHQYEHKAGQIDKSVANKEKAAAAETKKKIKDWKTKQWNPMPQKALPAPPPRTDFNVAPGGLASKQPMPILEPNIFGMTEGLPFQSGELKEIRQRTGDYEEFPVKSKEGQRALENRKAGGKERTKGMSAEEIQKVQKRAKEQEDRIKRKYQQEKARLKKKNEQE